MIIAIDHVVLLVSDLAAAAAAYELLLGRTPAWRGSADGTETVLFTLRNTTLELMAPSGDGPVAKKIRTMIKLTGEGLASVCFKVNDIEKMHTRLERVALKPDAVAEVESRDTTPDSEATLSWKRTRASTDTTRGIRMFFLELAAQRPHSHPIAPAPIVGLDHIVISTADPERCAALYGARLGLEMVLDRSNQEWGRLMFFRCGDAIVEIVQRPVAGSDENNDKLWGLSWRVADIEATRTRLLDAGVVVSESRNGRKPGTRVVTVRSSTCGIPTLLVQPSPPKL
jgi:catechol 2,3-dioxygenase-like lactoylglutathione lyase family enzyme